ncbi:MAG: zinc-dependent metalloprotease family protein [Pseudomonadota bacterium]
MTKKIIFGLLALVLNSTNSGAALIVNPPAPIVGTVTVQPIVVSDNDGTNQANYFGNASQQASILGFVDTIWSQAGLDIEFLAPNFWNSSFANEGLATPRPQSDLTTIVSNGTTAGVTNLDSAVINMFFVNVVPGFEPLNANFAAGLAYVGANGIAQYVGTSLLSFETGREVIASVVAHEIAHNLGLPHNHIDENLMGTGSDIVDGERLNADQIADVLTSQFVTAVVSDPVATVPIPITGGVFMFFALLTGGWYRSRC